MLLFDNLRDPSDTVEVFEYRLAFSGTVYHKMVGDWTRSTIARVLVQAPFLLMVSSEDTSHDPVELTLRFGASRADVGIANFIPHEEIANDLCALLAVYCRRLVTVATPVRVALPADEAAPGLREWPLQLNTSAPIVWPRRPSTVVRSMDSIRIFDHAPMPVPFSGPDFARWFAGVTSHPNRDSIVRAARMYVGALQQMPTNVEAAYQLAVIAIETVAGVALAGWQPDETSKLSHSTAQAVLKAAKSESIDETVAKRIALSAVANNEWISGKFREFLRRYVPSPEWPADGTDDLHPHLELFRAPNKLEFNSALSEIYSSRSQAVHAGKSYPAAASVSLRGVPIAAMPEMLAEKRPFPPLAWFERVVNLGLNAYIRESIAPAG